MSTQSLLKLNTRRKELRMTYGVLASRSGVSEATVKRILSGKCAKVGLDKVEAIAAALGLRLGIEDACDAHEYRRSVAIEKARWIMRQVQGTSALESQALPEAEYNAMISRTTEELLAGPARRLWA
ncbi:MAG: helix-turn-helix domain-containing protein [Pirellulaceae bacterium]